MTEFIYLEEVCSFSAISTLFFILKFNYMPRRIYFVLYFGTNACN